MTKQAAATIAKRQMQENGCLSLSIHHAVETM